MFCPIKTRQVYGLAIDCLVLCPCNSIMHAGWTPANLVCAYVPGTHELFWCSIGISAEHGKAESGYCSFQNPRGAHRMFLDLMSLCTNCKSAQQD